MSLNIASTAGSYAQNLLSLIKVIEGTRTLVYVDTVGVPTIGWGFALSSDHAVSGVVNQFITQILGIDPNRASLSANAKAQEQGYYNQLVSWLNFCWMGDNTTAGIAPSSVSLRNDLNGVLQQRYNELTSGPDKNYDQSSINLITSAGTIPTVFQYSSDAQMVSTWNTADVAMEGRLDRNVFLSGSSLPLSNERAALIGVAYQGGLTKDYKALLNAALNLTPSEDARASTWYTIRYCGTYPARQYDEAALFGLYQTSDTLTPSTTDASALAALRMYSLQNAGITAKEKANSGRIADENKQMLAAGLPTVCTLQQALQPAATQISADFGNGQTYSYKNIFVSGDGYGATKVFAPNASTGNLLIGGFAKGELDGGTKSSSDTYEYLVPATGGSATETIKDSDGLGSIYVYSGGSAIKLGSTSLNFIGKNLWTDGTFQYAFTPNGLQGGADVGVLTVTGGGLGTGSIVLSNFNLNAAQQGTGWTGIYLGEQIALMATKDWNPFNDGTYEIPADSTYDPQQGTLSLTAYASATRPNAQTVTISMTQGDASGFAIDTGNNSLTPLASGPVTLTIPAGQTSVTFGLVNTSDVVANESVQLTETLQDTAPGGAASSVTNKLTIGYVPQPNDPTQQPTPQLTSVIVGQATTSGSLSYIYYQGDGKNDLINAGNSPSQIAGGAGNDSIVCGSGSDTIGAGSGNDTINLGGGSDMVFGVQGNDVITGGGGPISVLAGSWNGNERFFAGGMTDLATAISQASTQTASNSKGDFFVTGGGDSTVVGSTGNDYFALGTGDNVVVCGPGNNVVDVGDFFNEVDLNWTANVVTVPGPSAGTTTSEVTLTGAYGLGLSGVSNTGTDYIFGGKGNNMVMVNSQNIILDAGSGNDTVSGPYNVSPGNVTILGGTANVSFSGFGESSYIQAGDGNVSISGGWGSTTIIGGSGNDSLNADNEEPFNSKGTDPTLQHNLIQGGSGNTTINGSAGSDTLIAGSGNTSIYGGIGNELIEGGTGNDLLAGNNDSTGGGNDTIFAGAGNDTIAGNYAGNLTIFGGSGNDTIYGSTGNDVIYAGDGGAATVSTFVLTGGKNDTVYGGSGVDLLEGSGAGNDIFYAGDGGTADTPTTVIGGTGSDTIIGGAGSDVLTAQQSTSALVQGGTGDATLIGGTGTDTLIAGAGTDVIKPTAQTNVLVFDAGNGSSTVLASSNGANETITFGADLDPTDITMTAQLFADGSSGLVLDYADGSTTIMGGLSSTQLASVSFGGAQTLTLAQLAQQANVITQNFNGGTFDLVLSGRTGDSLTGITGNDSLFGYGGGDTFTAGPTATLMVAGGGNDTFVVNSSNDLVQEATSAPGNLVQSSASYTLPANIAQLTLTGSGNLTGTGNSLDDVITGNAGNDTLVAGAGNDTLIAGSGLATLIGGSGNDTFVLNSSSDVVVMSPTPGSSNSIVSSVSYALPAGVQNLGLTGTANLTATGNALNNVLTANSGNDTLVAGSGVATLVGGTGIDTFIVNNASDVVAAQAAGTNAILSSVSYVLPVNVQALTLTGTANLSGSGNNLDDIITGNAGNDTLIAGSGNDTLVASAGPASLVGSSGNDTFIVNNAADVVTAQAGATNTILSSVSYVMPTNVQALTLTGTANLTATGNSGNDIITGNSGNDSLVAGSGNDTLVAGAGVATLVGGTGNNTFVIDNAADVLVMQPGALSNVVVSSVSMTMPANVTKLTLVGSGNLTVTGNALSDLITANAGNDTLIAGSGIDTFVGGSGNDTFEVNNTADVISEQPNNGNNAVLSSVSYVLPANLQSLTLTGTANLSGTGNNLNDVITANSGNDTLVAGSANDTLVSGSGVDSLVGGSGNDTFVLNNASDIVALSATPGSNNTVVVTGFNYVLPANIENLTLSGTANLKGTGNSLNDVITANSGNDTLVAGSGNDTLVSGSGIDSLVGGIGNDTFVVNNAADIDAAQSTAVKNTVVSSVNLTAPAYVTALNLAGTADLSATGNTLSNVITGNSGNDTLAAGSGLATLIGGTGNNTFVVNNTADVVVAQPNGGNDTVMSSVSCVVPVNVENLTLTGTGNLTATANSGSEIITGNNGNDSLVGGAGSDTLIGGGSGTDTLIGGTGPTLMEGGAGNDVFVVNSASDTVGGFGMYEISSFVYSVLSSVNFSIPDVGGLHWDNIVGYKSNVPINVTLTGGANLTAIDNNGGNMITANSGNDWLEGSYRGCETLVSGSGIDTLVSHDDNQNGVDLLEVNNASDVVIASPVRYQNQTEIQSTVSFTDPANADFLYLVGSHLVGIGNNDANDTLQDTSPYSKSNSPSYDTLIGGSGNDKIFTSGNYDSLVGGSGTGEIAASGSNVTLQGGTGSHFLSGAGANDILVGGIGNDTLSGATSYADTMIGGTGNNTFIINNTANVVVAQPNAASNIIGSGLATYTLPSSFNTLVLAGSTTQTGIANNGNDLLLATNQVNYTYADTLIGGTGTDVLEGGGANDLLKDTSGKAALIGGTASYASDTITGGAFNDFVMSGAGADTITLGAGSSVLAFNTGDGADTIIGAAGSSHTISLGGSGINYNNLTFSVSGSDLVLHVSSTDSVTFKGWYTNKSPVNDFVTLQVIEGASSTYNPSSTNALYTNKVETFNFAQLVAQFNAAGKTNGWSLMNDLLADHLTGTDTAAIGSDLAYYAGLQGNLTGMNLSAAVATLGNTQFGTGMQTIDTWQSISGGPYPLR